MKYRTIRKYALIGLYYHTMIYGQSGVAITYSYFMGILGPHQRMSGKWLHFFDGSEPINHNQTHRRAIDAEEIKPMANICNECGYPLQGNEKVCPECGCPIKAGESANAEPKPLSTTNSSIKPTIDVVRPDNLVKIDWAQYFYECGVIGWEAFKKYFSFDGRASRREFWSLYLIWCVVDLTLVFIRLGSIENILASLFYTSSFVYIFFFFPFLGASIRRLHDIGKSGWWCICPFANIFLYLKKSDEGKNEYGIPNPAKNLL